MTVLSDLMAAVAGGAIEVVDLTVPLEPATPVIGLPAAFEESPGVTIDEISRYDERGPAWCWNTIRMGEHTGTHFDAPIHWVTRRFDPPFPNHGMMHGVGKFGRASLCNLDRLPPAGAVLIAAPLKIVNGSGSPLRVPALVPVP
ncbi:MAG: cyclase family protein [Planctomycetota bacterium]